MDEKNSPIIFSEWLRLRRKALDMTQDELAKRVGCSVGALRKIEAGDRRPSKQLAGLLAKALEIPDEDLQTFIRVARGEINLERLGQPAHEPLPTISDLYSLQQAQPRAPSETKFTPPTIRIPLETTPLIGRDTELAALERLVHDKQCRLLTLTGVGGIGKTRLAIEFAARNTSAYPGGIFYIPLTPVTSPGKIVPAIAEVLDFGFSGPSEPKEQLLHYIASHIKQKALFILDNLEHLLVQALAQRDQPGVVELVAEILQRLPNISILGTSRERLNLHGEWTYELHGLTVPPTDFTGRLEDYFAIALFISSAQRIKADFYVAADEEECLIKICRLVEGVPLAIELAAAWVGVLSCREIAQEIQTNMDFLSTTMHDIPERHRSIRATFDHSWRLLTEEECWTLCQLAVFQGGFDRNAANLVAGASLPLLASLRAKSLVRHTEEGRYDLHEVIRQYALSHLNEHPDKLKPRNRHCEYYLGMVRDYASLLKSSAQQETIRKLTGEIDNIRAAWVWAIEQRGFDQIGQAGRGFGWYFEITGLYREGIEQLELLGQVLKAGQQDDQQRRLLGLLLNHQALLNLRKGEFESARRLYEESILFLRPIGDEALLSDSLVFLATVLHLQGEYESARSLAEEGLLFARQSNERWFEAMAIYTLGHIASLTGQYAQGYEQSMAGLSIWRALGDPHAIALGLNFLVTTLINLGRFEEAKSSMQESIALCEQSKNSWGMGTAYRYLGLVYISASQPAEARTYLVKSLDVFGEFAVGWDIARSLAYLGDAAVLSGDFAEANHIYRDALQSSIEAQAAPIAMDVMAGLGELQAKTGKLDNALLYCYYILHHPASEDETRCRAGQLRTALEASLSPDQITAARTTAARLMFDEMVSLVLKTTAG